LLVKVVVLAAVSVISLVKATVPVVTGSVKVPVFVILDITGVVIVLLVSV
jgi:hypothetical protein